MPLPQFCDEIVGVVDFKSSWRQGRESAHASTQTRGIKTEDSSCQTITKEDEGVQTEADDKDTLIAEEEDNEKLLAFLKNVERDVCINLIRNSQSTAFEGYTASSEADSGQCSNLYTFTCNELQRSCAVTSLSWNSTGSVIAASFGEYDHEDWCTHKAGVCVWNLNKSLSGSKPEATIETSSCLMSVAFHPVEPALVAGGSFNGEVLVWDLSKENDLLTASSVKGTDSHNEPISKVLWIPAQGKRRSYNVLSVSNDGKMLIWSLNKDKGKLKLESGCLLLAKSMPKSVKVKTSKKLAEMGVTSISFNAVDDSVFYVGAESGGMFKCSLNPNAVPLGGGDPGDMPLYDPVTFKFLPHKGPVYSVAANPFHRNLFVSCSSDTTLQLHSALQTEPLMVLEPASGYLYAASWSPVRPLVMAIATQNGLLLIYDLKRSQNIPVQKLDAGTDGNSVYTIEFNNKQHNLLATGDSSGVIKVWKLNDDLTVENSSEREYLNSIVDATKND